MSLEKYHWFGSSSTSGNPDDRPRTAQPGEVAVASRMPDLVVHYRARTVVMAEVATTSDRSEAPRGMLVTPSHGQRSGSSSPGTWGPRVADEDMDLNQQWPSGNSEGVSAPATRIGWPGYKRSPKPVMVARAEQGLRSQSRPVIVVPTSRSRREDTRSSDLSSSVPGAEPIRWKSSTQKAFVNKFDDRLTSEVAKSSCCSNPFKDSSNLVNKLVEAVCLAFLGNVAVRDLFNRMEEKVTSMDSKAKSARSAEKSVEERAKATEEKVKDAENRASQAESARRKAEEAHQDAKKRASQAEDDLAATRSEQSQYLQEVLPAALDQAWLQAAKEYQNSDEFNTRLLAEYKDGMWDMKAGFNLTNPTVTGVDWSFVPEISGETAAEEGQASPEGLEEELTQVQLWSVPDTGTSTRGPGTTGVQGLPEQTLSWVLLGHLLWSAWVFLRIDPSPTLVGVQHGDLSPWSGDLRSNCAQT
ncbi:hypothetical protein TIFTF001_039813 [Ficus carica]|uniref:Uncharacterized protein n=1 Tax=Ficus carica TaxID=3494 RepID=A0AA87YPF0_FICCA|nr:hypothetical protein TIFTF001_039800 [Ficus carica]GMN19432.1 hypothetical protein TIFTF001_039803 [Ficus carica]GMN19448.1 hypothetical protein TIFTF001_039810 [Ficus carica]GMN19463.1 hypothetical protein TIFTF001_039813 [Ficus carica]